MPWFRGFLDFEFNRRFELEAPDDRGTDDPELSNLFILTAGLGIRPTERSSIDLVYHHYRQHRSADALRDASVDADPEGGNRAIGNGLDLIFGFREFEDIDFEAIFGVFAPGSAFSDEADPAYFVGIELEFSF